jgi:hypothetical protein
MALFRYVNEQSSSWILGCGVIEIFLSGIYMWVVTIWHKPRPILGAVLCTVFALMIGCYLVIPIIKLMGPINALDDFAILHDCHGAIMFSAGLLKVNYAVPVLLFTGIFTELGALILMVCQIKVAIKRNESSKSAVG